MFSTQTAISKPVHSRRSLNGEVAPNGATYFYSRDLDKVRAFLRAAGLGVAGIDHKSKPIWMGWCSRDEKKTGAIYSNGAQGWVGSWWTV